MEAVLLKAVLSDKRTLSEEHENIVKLHKVLFRPV